jgi:hypothetical protein
MARPHTYDLATVVRLTKRGLSASEIGRRLDVSARTIERARDAAGLAQTRNLPPFEERLAIAQRIYEDGGALKHAQELAHIGAKHLRKLFPDWEPWDQKQVSDIGNIARSVAQLPNRLY